MKTHLPLHTRLILPLMSLGCLFCQPLPAQPPDVTSEVVDLGSTGTWRVISLVRHRDRLYLVNGAQGQSAQARYYDLATQTFTTEAYIPVEAPYGAVVKQGDLLWYGEDTLDDSGSVLHLRRHDGWRVYRTPAPANAHSQSQYIYDGKLLLADYFESYPGVSTSYDAGVTYLSKRLAGQNGFKAMIDGFTPRGVLMSNFFEYKGNLFSSSSLTSVTKPSGTADSSMAENFLMRYTGDTEKPWELTYDRLSQLGFLGRGTLYGGITASTRPGYIRWIGFKNYLFLDWYGVLNRYSAQTVASKFDPSVTYDRPANPVLIANNLTADGTTLLPGGNSKFFSPIVRHGCLYFIESPPNQRVLKKSTDGLNFTTVCTINTGTGSPLATLNSKELFLEIVGEDIYFAADTRLYKIPGVLLGANKPTGTANSAPVAQDDSFPINTGFATQNHALLGPLRNDMDADSDAFYATLVSTPSHGAVEFRYNGTFEYSAFGGFLGADSFTYKITDGYGESTATVSVAGAAIPANTSFTSAKIDFQSGNGASPSGWLIDNGAVRAARNGSYYGWDTPQSGLNRTENSDPVLNTLMRMGTASRWQISVPNGTYLVKATLGDAGSATSGMSLNVEGISYLLNGGAAANQFFTITDVVTVTDGWISVDNGASGSSVTRLNSLEIQRVTSPLPFPSALVISSVSDSQVQLAWQDNSVGETGFEIERRVGNSTIWQPLTVKGANASSHTDAAVSPITQYTYRVRAVSGGGVSMWSQPATGLTPPPGLPASDPVYNPSFHWKLDETSGALAVASGTNNLSLSLTGSPAWNPAGQVNGALQLNGTSQYGRGTDTDQLDATSQLTISGWVRPSNLTGEAQFILSKRASSSSQLAYSVFFFTGNKLFVDFDTTDNSFSSNTTFSNSTWYHIAVVFDGGLPAAERARIYVNGVLDAVSTETSGTLPNSTADIYLGQGDSASTARFSGLVDDVRIYRTALDSNRVATLYYKIPPVSTSTPPEIITPPQSQTAYLGQPVTFSVTATGNPEPTYQWKRNSANLQGATGTSYTTPGTTNFDHGASYAVAVTNSAGGVTSAAAILSLRGPSLAEWRALNFSSSDLADPSREATVWGLSADPDDDGHTNLVEYATATPPNVTDSTGPAVLSTESDRLVLTFQRLSPATVDYRVEASNDMLLWSPLTELASGTSVWSGSAAVSETGTGAIRTVKVTDIVTRTANPMRFLRLKISTPGGLAVSFPAINLTQGLVSAYGIDQDGTGGKPTSGTVVDGGLGLNIAGNSWKRHPYSCVITANTRLELTVESMNAGEILGFSLDSDLNPTNSRRAFRLAGSDVNNPIHDPWSWKLSPLYSPGSGPITYVIPVGSYFTGPITNLGFIGDDDALGATNATFTNVRIYDPPGASPDIIVDDVGAGVTFTGAWSTSSSAPGYYGAGYVHDGNTGKGTKTVQFSPNIPVMGSYSVYIRYNSDPTRAANVPVDVIHSGGTAALTLDQRVGGGAWVRLGVYTFAPGLNGKVIVRNAGTSGYVIADAVRFSPN